MLQPIILVAGKGTRMQTAEPKTLFPLKGKPMINWLLDMLAEVEGAKSPLIVIGHNGDMIRERVGDAYTYVTQTELTGPASGVAVCAPIFSTQSDPVVILYGDNPFVAADTIRAAENIFNTEKATLVFGVVEVPHFADEYAAFYKFSRILRKADGTLDRLVEYKYTTEEQRQLREVSPGVFCIDPVWLAGALPRVVPAGEGGEYYLTDLIRIALEDGVTIATVPLAPREGVGINSIEDAACAQFFL